MLYEPLKLKILYGNYINKFKYNNKNLNYPIQNRNFMPYSYA